MTSRGLQTDSDARLQELLGGDAEKYADLMERRSDRREEISRLVRADEEKNAEFYRQLERR
jgi:hypothetical protein